MRDVYKFDKIAENNERIKLIEELVGKVGGNKELAKACGISPDRLRIYKTGVNRIPYNIFEKLIKLKLEA